MIINTNNSPKKRRLEEKEEEKNLDRSKAVKLLILCILAIIVIIATQIYKSYMKNFNYMKVDKGEHIVYTRYNQNSKEVPYVNINSADVKSLNDSIVDYCNNYVNSDDIKIKYPDMTFIGTVPAIKVVHDNYPDKNTIVLTTKGTFESERFRKLYNKYKTDKCTLVQASKLANLIENNRDTSDYLKDLLQSYKNTEIVVLGCTHFPLVKNEIENVLGSVLFIDGGKGIAKRIDSLITKSTGPYRLEIIETSKKVENIIKDIVK